MGETSGMGPAFKVVRIGIRQRLAHKKYKKKSDAKAIARQIKKIQGKPDKSHIQEKLDKVYTPYPPIRRYGLPKREYVSVTEYGPNGEETTPSYMSVHDPSYKALYSYA